MKKVILADFDGTLTHRDTTRHLILELLAMRPWRLRVVLGHLLCMTLARDLHQLQDAKYRLIGRLVQGLYPAELDSALAKFSKTVRRLRRPTVVDALEERRKNGHLILIVTASPEFAVAAALSDLRVEVLGTRFAVKDGRFTGEICGLGCFGVQKPICVAKWALSGGGQTIYEEAWSDAASDLPLMQMASSRFWVCGLKEENAIRGIDPDGRIFLVD